MRQQKVWKIVKSYWKPVNVRYHPKLYQNRSTLVDILASLLILLLGEWRKYLSSSFWKDTAPKVTHNSQPFPGLRKLAPVVDDDGSASKEWRTAFNSYRVGPRHICMYIGHQNQDSPQLSGRILSQRPLYSQRQNSSLFYLGQLRLFSFAWINIQLWNNFNISKLGHFTYVRGLRHRKITSVTSDIWHWAF
jgi:hypothetical protein